MSRRKSKLEVRSDEFMMENNILMNIKSEPEDTKDIETYINETEAIESIQFTEHDLQLSVKVEVEEFITQDDPDLQKAIQDEELEYSRIQSEIVPEPAKSANTISLFYCYPCRQSWVQIALFKEHMESKHKDNSKLDLRCTPEGLYQIINGSALFNCWMCQEGFDQKGAFTKHMSECKSGQWPCETCKKWMDKHGLDTHMCNYQGRGSIYKCSICLVFFENKEDAMRHVVNFHAKPHAKWLQYVKYISEKKSSSSSKIKKPSKKPKIKAKKDLQKRKLPKDSQTEPQTNSDLDLFKCRLDCDFVGTMTSFRSHIQKCRAKFRDQRFLLQHSCMKCNVIFNDFHEYLAHFQFANGKQFYCPECKSHLKAQCFSYHIWDHVFQNFDLVQTFEVTGHFKEMHRCQKCNVKVKYNGLYKHWESHTEIADATCLHVIKSEKLNDRSRSKLDPENRSIPKTILGEVISCLIRTRQGSKGLRKECPVCLRQFSRYNDIKRHIVEHMLVDALIGKEQMGLLCCQVCGMTTETIEMYKKHMRDHASLPEFKCELCFKYFADSSNFAKHKKVHNIKVMICDLCLRKFRCKRMLELHMLAHRNREPIACEMCGKVFHFRSAYAKHLKNAHFKANYYRHPCKYCSKYFTSLKDKWEHLWEVHKQRKSKADCPLCDKRFRKLTEVKRHVSTAHSTISKHLYEQVVKVIRAEYKKTET